MTRPPGGVTPVGKTPHLYLVRGEWYCDGIKSVCMSPPKPVMRIGATWRIAYDKWSKA